MSTTARTVHLSNNFVRLTLCDSMICIYLKCIRFSSIHQLLYRMAFITDISYSPSLLLICTASSNTELGWRAISHQQCRRDQLSFIEEFHFPSSMTTPYMETLSTIFLSLHFHWCIIFLLISRKKFCMVSQKLHVIADRSS